MKKITFIFLLGFVTTLQAVSNVSVVTFNTQKLCDEVGDAQYNAIGRIVRHLDADVFMFQEIPISTAENLVSLRDDYLTNYYVIWSGNHDGNNRQAVLSRFPIIAQGDVVTNTAFGEPEVIYTNKFTRELLWAKVELPESDNLNIFSAHLKATGVSFPNWDKKRRENEARMINMRLEEFVSNNPASQILLGGDMNVDNSDTGSYGQAVIILTNSTVQTRYTVATNPDTGSDYTFDGDARFDYQFPNPRLTDLASLVFRSDVGTVPAGVFESDTTNASDHYPVWFNYEVGPAQNTNFAKIMITEVDVWRSANYRTNKYIELFNAGSLTQNLQGWEINDLEKEGQVIADAPAILFPGDYALIQYNETEVSDITSEGDGILNLYISNSLNFTTTDDQLVLLDKSDFIVDGVIWNNNNSTLGNGEDKDFNEMCRYSWICPLIKNDNPTQYNERTVKVRGTLSSTGQSLFRWMNKDYDYIETDKKNDWSTRSVGSPGEPNIIYIPPQDLDLIFTEIGVWQDDGATTQKFIELYNVGNTTVDISGCIITDFDGIDDSPLSTNSAWLLPEDYAVLYFGDGTNDTTSADDGVLNIYNVDNNIKTLYSSDGFRIADYEGKVLDAVVYFSDNGSTNVLNEISDLGELCPKNWNYSPEPTNWSMYFSYAVSASPDGGTNSPGRNDSISRYLFDDIADEYIDRDLKLDWYVSSQDITPGTASKESTIPEPISFFIYQLMFILLNSARPKTTSFFDYLNL